MTEPLGASLEVSVVAVFTHLRAIIVGIALLLGLTVVGATPASAAAGTTYTWQGSYLNPHADGHSWTDPLNWSPVGVPGNGDSVVIAPPARTACAAHVDTVPDGVALTNFTLFEEQFGPDGLCEASVSGGSISVAGSFTLNSGQIDTPMTLLASSSGTITPGSGVLDSSTLSQNVTVDGSLAIDGNQDLSTSSGQGVLLYEGISLTIAKGGQLDANDSNDINTEGCCVNPSRVINNGTVQVNGGQLRFDAVEFDQNGQLATASSGQVRTTSAPNTASDGATYTGDGSWLTYDGTTVLTGVQTLGTQFGLVLGGVDIAGSEALGGDFSLAGSGSLEWDGGLLEADATIGHAITVKIDGPTAGTNDHRELSGQDATSSTPSAPVTITNHGTIEFADHADLYGTFGAGIVNQRDGTISLEPGTALSSGSAAGIVNDGGTVVVPSASTSDPAVLSGFGYSATKGSLRIAAGDQLQLIDGADSSFSSTSVSGGGALLLASPATLAGSLGIAASTSVRLADPGSVTASAKASVGGAGRFSWSGGSFSGSITLAPTGGVGIHGAIDKQIFNLGSAVSAVTISAPLAIAAGTAQRPDEVDLAGDSTLTLAGASTVGADVTFSHGHLVNTGSLSVRAAARHPVHVDSADFANRGTATVSSGAFEIDNDYVQTAGRTLVAAGASIAIEGSSSVLRLTGGQLGGAGRIAGLGDQQRWAGGTRQFGSRHAQRRRGLQPGRVGVGPVR